MNKDIELLQAYVDRSEENGTHLPGMTYEQGIQAVIDLARGQATAEEIING